MEVKGVAGLTNRQTEVVKAFMRGLDREGVARTLYISKETIKAHWRDIGERTGCRSHIQVAVALYRQMLQDAIAQEIQRVIADGASEETKSVLERLAARIRDGELDPLKEEIREAA